MEILNNYHIITLYGQPQSVILNLIFQQFLHQKENLLNKTKLSIDNFGFGTVNKVINRRFQHLFKTDNKSWLTILTLSEL